MNGGECCPTRELTTGQRPPGELNPAQIRSRLRRKILAARDVEGTDWRGRWVAQASYEAVMLAAAEQASNGGSNKVLLTRIGGGVFRNGDDWIDSAIGRAMDIVRDAGLDIVHVAHGQVSPGIRAIVDRYGS